MPGRAPSRHPGGVSAVTVRTATLEDLPGIRAVFRASSLSNAGDRAALLAHPEALELPDACVHEGRTLVAVAGDRVIGFATTIATDAGVELEDLFVEPGRTRRGVGRRLLRDVVARGRASGARRIDVTANDHATGFYEAVGFVRTGAADTPFGPAVRMRRDL
ncbi:MAG: GNAT family N-acetyltransferase [Acidimicrobiia bacterium]|nr:GNAT family N-acetyltransferase [Acidimicrobiia bacterium]